MEVMVGSSFGIGMVACVRDRTGVSAQDKAIPAAALFLLDESGSGGSQIGLASRIGLRINKKSPEESSEDSSSSIRESSGNEEEEEDDAVSFQGRGGGTLDSFSSSLEDSLPIKRGLSNHYVGKSKSFGNLVELSNINAKDLEKAENLFNKRRRLLIANKLRSRGRSISDSNFYTWQNPNSMPLLVFQEHNELDHHNDDEYGENDGDDQTMKLLEKRKMMENRRELIAQTQSCFCLSSLQEEDDEDGGNNDE